MPESNHHPLPNPQATASGCLARFFWAILGNIAIAASFVFIIKHGKGFSTADIVLGLLCAAVIGARYWDIAYCGGTTGSGDRKATLHDWQRYSCLVFLICLSLWLLIHWQNASFGSAR